MAVEARHMNLFASQPNMNNNNNIGQIDISGGFPVPMTNRQSDLTYAISSKRQRDDSPDVIIDSQKRRQIAFASLIDAELVSHLQQQQSEIDRFVTQQTETLRYELEARQRTQTRLLASAFQTAILRKMKAKDEEISRMGKLNWVLQERVKNLYVENQIWRDLAQTNEATANNLRSNLEQVLAQVDDFPVTGEVIRKTVVEDDVESSCGSCDGGDVAVVNGGCRRCGERTASVLVLPCRHLCLCTVCGTALLKACPVCDMVMNASVHVNMSS
ncbi:hypothetical protein AALP_AA2G179000 [Arabis alpina]|uniref:RING-type domain-containing protein n=1 Tax=Arabis alpina TaxID=50452 RepID=A0A087HI98_ARAAL|nr:hypothetical protein AALP_AA2G179000 [Arabis alpina]